jgi:hypothetical protein
MVAAVLTVLLSAPFQTEEDREAARLESWAWPAAFPDWRPPPIVTGEGECMLPVPGPNPDEVLAEALDAFFEAFSAHPESRPAAGLGSGYPPEDECSCCLPIRGPEEWACCEPRNLAPQVPVGYLRIGGASWDSIPAPRQRCVTHADLACLAVGGNLAVLAGALMHRNRRKRRARVAKSLREEVLGPAPE